MDHRDLYLRRAVRGAIALLEDDPDEAAILAYHLAVGIALQPDGGDVFHVSKIIKDGIWALHHTAHEMAANGEILLEDYADKQITSALVACEMSIRLVPGGRWKDMAVRGSHDDSALAARS